MKEEINWLSPAVGQMYSNLLNNLGDEEFNTKVVKAMYPDWSTSYINKNLHELIKRGWAKRIKKGTFKLKDFEDIAKDITPSPTPLNVFLELLEVRRFIVTSYLASQFLTNYIHTTPKITILSTKEDYNEISTFLKAKSKFLERNTFMFLDSYVKIILKLVHPFKFEKLLKNSQKIEVANKSIQVTDPATTLEFLSKETEDRRFADMAYLLMKTYLGLNDLEGVLSKKEIKEVTEMINYKKDRLVHSTPFEILEMNMVKT